MGARLQYGFFCISSRFSGLLYHCYTVFAIYSYFSLSSKVCDNEIFGEDHFIIQLLNTTSSYKNRSKSFTLMSDHEYVALDSQNLDYDVTVLLSKPKDYIKNLNLKICLQRKIARSVMEIILPPAMLVVVSWVSIR